MSPPSYTSKAVTYRGLKQNSEGPSFVPLTSILGLYLLSVDGKLRQLFSPRTSSFPPIWNLSPVPIFFPWKPLMLMLPNCPSQSPTQPLGVREDWSELQVQSGTKIKLRESQKQGHGPEITQPQAADPKAHDPLPTATLGTGSVAKGINPEDCGSLKYLGIPQKFHVINPEKNNQPKHWASTNSFEQLLICIPSPPPEALPLASLPLPAPLECFLASGSS